MATAIDQVVNNYDEYSNINKALTTVYHVEDTTSLVTGDVIFNHLRFYSPVRVIGFNGVRTTKGGSSGTTTIELQDLAGNKITDLDFTYAGGNNLFVGADSIDSDYSDIYIGEGLKAVVTAEETTVGVGLKLNVYVRYL